MGNDAVAVRPRLRNGRQAAGAGSAGSVGLGPARLASPRWPGAPAARGRGRTQPVGLPGPWGRPRRWGGPGRRGAGRGPLDTPRNRPIASKCCVSKGLCVFSRGGRYIRAGVERIVCQPVARIHLPPPSGGAVGGYAQRAATPPAAGTTRRRRAGRGSRGRGGAKGG
jgi:hypothetical protein